MNLPAQEFVYWQSYFNIYPFTQDREDERTALLAELVNNIPQSLAYKNKKMTDFLPDYFGERKPVIVEKSLEQQRAEWAAFKEKYQDAQRRM